MPDHSLLTPDQLLGDLFDDVPDVDPDDGLATLLSAHPEKREAVAAALAAGPSIAMVDSDRGITNLHAPSDVIIDASMPAAIATRCASMLLPRLLRRQGRSCRLKGISVTIGGRWRSGQSIRLMVLPC